LKYLKHSNAKSTFSVNTKEKHLFRRYKINRPLFKLTTLSIKNIVSRSRWV